VLRPESNLDILIVSPQFPYPTRNGFTTRVYHLARQLSTRHNVTLLSYASPQEGDDVAGLARQMAVRAVQRTPPSSMHKRLTQALTLASPRAYYCREIHSRGMQQAIDELCSTKNFDVIQLESSFLCGFRFPQNAHLVLDEHNVEYELFQRMCEGERSAVRRAFNRREYVRFRRFEEAWWARVNACVVTSEREVAAVRSCAPETPLAVVPNAVDVDYFVPSNIPPAVHTVTFNGTLNYRPNLDAVRYLLDDIWPLVRDRYPDARLTLTGRNDDVDTRSLLSPGVEVLGEVPDVRPHISGATVAVAPLRIGGGTRLKVVEALAMGKPMVSTAVGCEGVAVRDGEHLLIADDAVSFASRICDLFEDATLRAALGEAGRCLVETRYSWELAAKCLESLYGQSASADLHRSTEFELIGAGT
jgi:glycosyltransferase involved in cell wall biosynthesis